jgi:hypothetical protein
MDSLILPSKFKVCRWCSLALLDEAMQQDHFALRVDIEQHPSNSVLTQARTYFVKSIAQRSANAYIRGMVVTPSSPSMCLSLRCRSIYFNDIVVNNAVYIDPVGRTALAIAE